MRFSKEAIRKAMQLYVVTDRTWLKGARLADVCKEVLEHGATFLQIREKVLGEGEFEREARELKGLCEAYGVPFVVNDNIEIARRVDADGVHVGQTDVQGKDVRALIGPDKILGISAATVEEARAAEQAGADYIGVGAVFGTSTKKNARNLTVETLREISAAVQIPVVAIGGINGESLPRLQGSGVDGVAVISAVFAPEHPGKAAEQLLKLSERVLELRTEEAAP